MYLATSHKMIRNEKDLIDTILNAFVSRSEIEIVADSKIVFKLFNGRILQSIICFKCEECAETKVEEVLQGDSSVVCVKCGSTIPKSAKDISKQIRDKKNEMDD